MDLLHLFNRCLNANYTTVENQGDYAIQQIGTKLYLFFEWSDSATDWKNNFDFPAKPYKEMGTTWHCHRGFLKVWKSIEPHVKSAIMKPAVKSITIVGYSHGAAIATLCHEYVWFNRPELRDKLQGYGFGAPRVFWGVMSDELKQRWKNFHIIRNFNDIVTYMPPAIFGFRHVNQVITIGQRENIDTSTTRLIPVAAHMPGNYIASLKLYDKKGGD